MSTATVEYRQLGHSGLRVSVPIIGAMGFGSPEWQPWVLPEPESLEVLKVAWDRGINTIDTSHLYSNGESERIVGNFIRKYQIPRNEILILTKVSPIVVKTIGVTTEHDRTLADTRDYVNQSGLFRATLFNTVDASLARLQTPYIDLLQIARFDDKVDPAETMKALHDLVQCGKVRYIGGSSMRCWQFAMLNEIAAKNGWTKFVSMQNEYSLLYREEEREMNAYCKYNGIGIIPWAPLAGGSLARPISTGSTTRTEALKGSGYEANPNALDAKIIARVEELAKKHGKTMAQIALAWTAKKITSPIVGITSVARLDSNMIRGVELTDEEVKYLEELYEPKYVQHHT